MKEMELLEQAEKYVDDIMALPIQLNLALMHRRLEYLVATINERAHFENHGCNLPMRGFCQEKYEFDKKMDARMDAWTRKISQINNGKCVEIRE